MRDNPKRYQRYCVLACPGHVAQRCQPVPGDGRALEAENSRQNVKISTISASFKRRQEQASPCAYGCPRTSSSKEPKSRNVFARNLAYPVGTTVTFQALLFSTITVWPYGEPTPQSIPTCNAM